MTNPIATPFTLPCGLEIKNRICKAPMTECLADARTNLPNERVFRVYERWARGGLGLIVTGNVPVDRRHPEAARNVALEAQDEAHLDLYRRYADACHVDGCKVVVQLTHAGRQSAGVVNKRPLAPSAVPLEMEGVPQFMLSSPVAMTIDDIEDVKKRFVTGALLCQKAGFDGIQCHAAHGYLLSEFLNPKVNRRTDAYGGAIQNRMRLLREIVSEIRQACGPNFAVSVKLNSSDFQKGGSTEDDNLEVLAMLENEAVDFVEISGGSYESPAMMGVLPRESTVKREAYFLEFAEKARKNLKIPLMVTGGFRTRAAMNDALASGACDLIGIGRPLCLHPSLPNELCTSVDPNYAVPTPIIDWNLVKPSERMFESIWHTMQIQRMSDGLDPDPTLKPGSAQGQIVRNLVFEPSLGFGTRWIWDAIWPVDARGHATRWSLVAVGSVGAAWVMRR